MDPFKEIFNFARWGNGNPPAMISTTLIKLNSGILAIIPAGLGTSKFPNRSVALFHGESLLTRTIKQAKASHFITRTVVTTDSQLIKEIALSHNITVLDRPSSMTHGVMLPTIERTVKQLEAENYKPAIIVILQVTSPLRTVEDIDGTIGLMLKEGTNSAMSVSPIPRSHTWETYWSPEGQEPENGAVYVSRLSAIYNAKECVDIHSLSLYHMPAERAADIDTEEELKQAEKYGLDRQ